MNRIRIDNILKKASYYEIKSCEINKFRIKKADGGLSIVLVTAIALALPVISEAIHSALTNTESIKEAVDQLLNNIATLEKRAEGNEDYLKFADQIKILKEAASKLSVCYENLAAGSKEAKVKAYEEIDGLLATVNQTAYTVRLHLDDYKSGFTKAWEAVEHFGVTFGIHNYIREVQESIDELCSEIAKGTPTIERMKKEVESLAQSPEVQEAVSKATGKGATVDASKTNTPKSKEDAPKDNLAELGNITINI